LSASLTGPRIADSQKQARFLLKKCKKHLHFNIADYTDFHGLLFVLFLKAALQKFDGKE
jgi:hypothetical protein